MLETEVEHVAGAKLNVCQASLFCLGASERQEVLRQVHAKHESVRTNGLRRRDRRRPSPTADIEHSRSRLEIQPLHGAPAEALPEGVGAVIVDIGRGIDGRARSRCGLLTGVHGGMPPRASLRRRYGLGPATIWSSYSIWQQDGNPSRLQQWWVRRGQRCQG
jgi:hypothetical protein